jgi:hypothetical protein
MVDVATTLKDLLYSGWIETDPEVTEVNFITQDIGHDVGPPMFDANVVSPQVAIEEIAIENILLSGELYKRVHTLSILVYLKPANYQPATIGAAQVTFKNMIEQIDDILKTSKYSTADLNDIQLSTWRIQTDKKAEPIIFVAAQEIKAVYYA